MDRLDHWLDTSRRRLAKARILLAPALPGSAGAWADLGCGDGVFTYLLAELLPAGSAVFAVDRDSAAVDRVTRRLAGRGRNPVHPVVADFTENLALPRLDGILMANSLHFVTEKQPLLGRIVTGLRSGGRLVVVEYNARLGNGAVPYPLPDQGFLRLADGLGLEGARIAARAPSTFLGEMYTGVARLPHAKGTGGDR